MEAQIFHNFLLHAKEAERKSIPSNLEKARECFNLVLFWLLNQRELYGEETVMRSSKAQE